MAKKIVISDLVLKLSLDSQKALSGLSKLDRETKTRNTSEIKAEKSKLKLAEKRVQSAKAFMAGSTALHSLKRLSSKEALGFEKKLKKAYLANDKTQINETKRKIRESLKEHKSRISNLDKTSKKETRSNLSIAKARVTSAKAYAAGASDLHALNSFSSKEALDFERQLKKAYLSNNKVQINDTKRRITSRLNEHKASTRNIADLQKQEAQAGRNRIAASKRQSALDRRLHSQRRRDTKWMARKAGGLGAMPMGAITTGAIGAGVAGGVATQQMLGFRRAEMSFRAAMNVSGSQTPQNEMFDMVQRNADYYNINRSRHLQAFAGSRAAITSDKLGDKELLSGIQGMSVAAAISGTTAPQLDKAQYGLQQILTSGIQAQEIRQITENMAAASPAVFKAIGQLTGEKVTGMGEVRTLAEQGALSGIDPVDFYKVFTGILNTTYKKEFEKYKNSLPVVFDRMTQRLHTGILLFAEGFDTDIKDIFNDITSFVENNQETIKSWGEVFGTVMTKVWAILKEIGTRLEPYLESISDYAKNLDPKTVTDLITNLIKLGLILKGAALVGGLATFIMNMEKMIKIMRGAGLVPALKAVPIVGTLLTGALLANEFLPKTDPVNFGLMAGANIMSDVGVMRASQVLSMGYQDASQGALGGAPPERSAYEALGGNTFHIGEITLPNVANTQDFADELMGTAISY